MSKVRNLPEITTLDDNDLLYAVDESVGTNGGRKITKANLKQNVKQSDAEIKTAYENNPDTNAFTDAEKTKLAGIEPGATADQLGSEVPFNNTGTNIAATNVEAAIKEVNEKASAEFRASILSGRILRIAAGNARFDGVFYSINSTDILLDQNLTNAIVYVDLDGIIKVTASNTSAPPYTLIVARVTTDSTDITALDDRRVKSAQNLIRGTLSDVRDVRAGAAASEGTSGRVSDAMHKHNVLTGAPSTQTPDQANAEGTSINLARADHTHNIPSGAPVSVGAANDSGVAASFSKSDHMHQGVHSMKANAGSPRYDDVSLKDGVGVTVTDDGLGNFTIESTLGGNELNVTQGAGLTANYSGGRVRFNGTTYNIPAGSFSVLPNATNGRIYVDVDGIVKSTTATNSPPNAIPLAIYSSGPVSILALTDNRSVLNNNIQFGVSGDISTLTPDIPAAAGSTNKFADAGHVHNVPAAAPSTQTPDQANAEGSSGSFARADHTHNIPAAAPSGLNATNANTKGTNASFALSDHLHAIATGTPSTQTPDQANATGSSANLARADHIHNIPAAAPVNTGSANSKGVAASFALSDHVHNTTIARSNVSSTTSTNTSSATDVQLGSMTLTPGAGTWAVFFEGAANCSNNTATMTYSIYANGVQVPLSERGFILTNAVTGAVHTNAVATVAAGQVIEVRYRTSAGTATVNGRSLTLIRLGD